MSLYPSDQLASPAFSRTSRSPSPAFSRTSRSSPSSPSSPSLPYPLLVQAPSPALPAHLAPIFNSPHRKEDFLTSRFAQDHPTPHNIPLEYALPPNNPLWQVYICHISSFFCYAPSSTLYPCQSLGGLLLQTVVASRLASLFLFL